MILFIGGGGGMVFTPFGPGNLDCPGHPTSLERRLKAEGHSHFARGGMFGLGLKSRGHWVIGCYPPN